jgi:DNA-binding NarL/FixJ family response regulator
MSETMRVAIVEDDSLLRDSLRALFAGSPGFSCIAVAGSVAEALRWRLPEPPEIVLLDIHMPGMPGSAGVVPLLAAWPSARILMHTVYDDDDKVFESLCNGAVGYILKRTPPVRLLEAVQEAHGGGAPMSPLIASRVLAAFRRSAPRPLDHEPLSPRERELLALLARGSSYAEAAREIGVSVNTVRTYIRGVYEKLQVHTKSEAVSKALRAGLI